MGKSSELSSEDGFRNLARARPRLRSRPLLAVRRDELDRRKFKDVARIPRLQKPHLAGGRRLQHVAARGACFDVRNTA
jgi:hypothetical protein